MLQSQIRKLRMEAGLQPEEAMEKLKISYSFLNKIELGDRRPGRDLIKRMSKVYGCSVDIIYNAIDEGVCQKC
ncbi:helix-turn-helix domain-containing protein [Clostridium pasteurianum]|uniref:Helix-turn-helix protein n=1 Tax=Clostridium pasteurianum BC1 TaxID=86416 RepID=R4KBI2_CLOPA|nr:helix-turn-helix transcriptional regulator [Clostridium pasteurianum]AGK99036.1 Helix-turn-helix protein [Clostridium pasteurianum BC1]